MRARPRPGDETGLRIVPAAGGFSDHALLITSGFWLVKRKIHMASRKTRLPGMHQTEEISKNAML